MAEDGYEVMGPAGGNPPPAAIPAFPAASAPGPPSPHIPPPPPPPAAVAPPPPPPTAKSPKVNKSEDESKMSRLDKPTAESPKKRKKKSSRKNKTEDSTIESAYGDGKEVHQRPNGCDVTQLSLVSFLSLLVMAISIPVVLAAKKIIEIDYLTDKLATM